MTKYIITDSVTGKEHRVEAPDGMSQEDVMRQFEQQMQSVEPIAQTGRNNMQMAPGENLPNIEDVHTPWTNFEHNVGTGAAGFVQGRFIDPVEGIGEMGEMAPQLWGGQPWHIPRPSWLSNAAGAFADYARSTPYGKAGEFAGEVIGPPLGKIARVMQGLSRGAGRLGKVAEAKRAETAGKTAMGGVIDPERGAKEGFQAVRSELGLDVGAEEGSEAAVKGWVPTKPSYKPTKEPLNVGMDVTSGPGIGARMASKATEAIGRTAKGARVASIEHPVISGAIRAGAGAAAQPIGESKDYWKRKGIGVGGSMVLGAPVGSQFGRRAVSRIATEAPGHLAVGAAEIGGATMGHPWAFLPGYIGHRMAHRAGRAMHEHYGDAMQRWLARRNRARRIGSAVGATENVTRPTVHIRSLTDPSYRSD